MFELRETETFVRWFGRLRDDRAKERIAKRLAFVQSGMLGDVKFFGGIAELRIDYGPGYRVYFVKRGLTIILLLCGGDKSSQDRDIARAKALAREATDDP
jgi:putative addiction module killer protein